MKGQLHPIAAALGATLHQSAQGLSLPDDAVQSARVALRQSTDNEALIHLAILAAKIHRIAGERGAAAIAMIGLLLEERVGKQEAATRFEAAGGKAVAAFLGRASSTSAPRAPAAAPTQAPKPRRGLS